MKTIQIIILLHACTILSAQNSLDFRNISWGMTLQEVVETEGLTPIYKGYDDIYQKVILKYELYIEQRKVDLYYFFEGGRVNASSYHIYWGNWQKEKYLHALSNRLFSMASIFKTLNSKGFEVESYWHFTNEGLTEEHKKFIDCQNDIGSLSLTKSHVNMLENCLKSYIDLGRSATKWTISVAFSNNNTNVYIKIPTKHYNQEVYHNIIAWIDFNSAKNTDVF